MQDMVNEMNKMNRMFHPVYMDSKGKLALQVTDCMRSRKVGFPRQIHRKTENQVIARRDYHDGSAVWFIRGDTFMAWDANGCLLWIHGKGTLFESPIFDSGD